jgi:hypothetical protein
MVTFGSQQCRSILDVPPNWVCLKETKETKKERNALAYYTAQLQIVEEKVYGFGP